jgi:hypothetical protein
MSTSTLTGTTPIAAPSARRTALHVARSGLVAGISGGVVLYAYGAAVAAAGVPMRAGDPWATAAEAVTPANFSAGVVLCTFWGTVLAVVVALVAARPSRVFVRTATALVGVSLAAPLAAVDTTVSTKLALALGHLIAAAVVVPLITRALPATRC